MENNRVSYERTMRAVPDSILEALRKSYWLDHRIACELIMATGLRVRDVLSLTVGDVIDDEDFVWIQQEGETVSPLGISKTLFHPELKHWLQQRLDLTGRTKEQKAVNLTYPAFYQWLRRNHDCAPMMLTYYAIERIRRNGLPLEELRQCVDRVVQPITSDYGGSDGG